MFQIQVLATDGGGKTAVGTVTVTVNRNLATPTWLQTAYTVTIPENQPLTEVFLSLLARDNDAVVSVDI